MVAMFEVLLPLAERTLRPRQDISATTVLPSSTISTPTALSTLASTPTPTQTITGNTTTSPSTSSPLLFFVALGFGVVFTNLWIIVGVKYCFRYNARNRALRNGEDLEVVNLDSMPTRPHRRRRDKKLMTMDEVNERFPLTKYKNWMTSRASQGLSTAGGVSSKSASLRDVDGGMPSSPVETKHSVLTPPPTATSEPTVNDAAISTTVTSSTAAPDTATNEKVVYADDLNNPELVPSPTVNRHATVGEEEEDDDDHTHIAVLPELLTSPGDSCAICIDTLEDDDNIRGLTCGHAFHAGCLDPWLTSRRACCPLCKADYFVAKPRPEGEPADPERAGRRRTNNTYLPDAPRTAWVGNIRGARLILPGRLMASPAYGGDAYDRRHSRRGQRDEAAGTDNGTTSISGAPAASRWRPRIGNPFSALTMPSMRIPGRNRGASRDEGPRSPAQPTPSALEAGASVH